MYSRNLGSTKATSNLLLHLKENLIHFILCLDMFCGVVIFNITTDFTSHSTGYQNHSYILDQIRRPVNNHLMDFSIFCKHNMLVNLIHSHSLFGLHVNQSTNGYIWGSVRHHDEDDKSPMIHLLT